MTIRIHIVSILILLFCIGCNKHDNYNEWYGRLKTQFDNESICHFPDSLVEVDKFAVKILSPENTKENGSCGAFLIIKTNPQQFNKIKNEYKDSILETYNTNDRCLTRVNMLKSPEAAKVFYDHYKNYCEDNYIPTPGFSFKLRNQSLLKFNSNGFLTEDFVIQILGADKGIFIDKNLLTNGVGLPEKWKNGRTKGLVLNERTNVIIFWTEIW